MQSTSLTSGDENTIAVTRDDGFTLIEILVALAIAAVVITALYSTFSLSHKAVSAVDDSLLRLQESRRVVDIIKRELESTFYSKDRSYSFFELDDRDFYGRQASRITFTAFSSLVPGLSKIRYEVEEIEGNLVLRKKVESAFAPSTDAEGIIMMDEIESFVVEALYRDKWIRTWNSELIKNMPDELRVSVVIRVGDEGREIAVSDIVRPRIGSKI
jgi:prepilin-type N-terminal cleavage/methylation domain-containing protein